MHPKIVGKIFFCKSVHFIGDGRGGGGTQNFADMSATNIFFFLFKPFLSKNVSKQKNSNKKKLYTK